MSNRHPQSTPSSGADQPLADRIVRLIDRGVHPVKILGDLDGDYDPREIAETLTNIQYLRNMGVPMRPEHPTDLDGFRAVVGLASWELRWNTTARRPEARTAGGDWEPCEGIVRDRMMTACERAATARGDGWRVRNVRRETRLINVLAGERSEAGEGSAAYAAAAEWLADRPRRRLKLADVFRGAGLLQKYESPNRAPKHVQADVRQALLDSGWRERSVRLPDGPRRRWCAPERRRVSLSRFTA